MAYPNQIRLTGPLDHTLDVFEYFKGALLDDDESTGNNPEKWPYYYDFGLLNERFTISEGVSLPNLPFSRQVFYDWIDYWTDAPDYYESPIQEGVVNGFHTISGSKLYTFESPQSGWPIQAVNDWGKIKSLELGLFGNVANGGSLSSQTIVGSGTLRSRIPHMKYSDPNYLRYGLIKFESYGSCHPIDASSPPPTNPVSNIISRTFDWTPAAGYPNLNQYEYSLKGGNWQTVTSKPIVIPFNMDVKIGELIVRTKSTGGYVSASEGITNNEYFIGSYNVYVYANIVGFDQLYVNVAIPTSEEVPWTNLTVSGEVQFIPAGGSFPTTQIYSVMLSAYSYSGSSHVGSVNPGSSPFIISGNPSPVTINGGKSVIVYTNDIPS